MRVVALGASNLTRGFATVVSTARTAWGSDVEILGALGHGRSYGAPSQLLFRVLPGILQSGLWRQLETLPPAPTRGLVTDVGNDVAYGHSAPQILAWVEEAIDRLRRFTDDVVLTDLPVANVRRLAPALFLLFRSVLVPECRLSQAAVVNGLERVNEGLLRLAAARNVRFIRLSHDWYGFDPIHIRRSRRQSAWADILHAEGRTHGADGSWLEASQLYWMRPEREWLFGRELVSPQTGIALRSGGRVWLF